MTTSLRRTPRLLAVAAFFGACSAALAAPPLGEKVDDLQSQVSQLKAANDQMAQQLAGLRSQQDDNWLTERRAEEVKTLIKEVLADADTRASLLEGGMTAGHNGKNFFLSSDDGAFLLKIGIQNQVRYIYNTNTSDRQADLNGDGDTRDAGEFADDSQAGFQLRRMKMAFEGHVADPKIGYEVVIAANRDTAAIGLEALKLDYKLNDQWTLAGGRFKAPFLREELTSSKRQLTVDRSMVNEAFTMGYSEGVSLGYSSDMFKLAAMLNDGQNAGEIGGDGDDFHNDNVDFAVTARGDIKLAGDWKQMEDFTAWDGEELGVFLGAAVHYQVGETGDRQGETAIDNLLSWTIDASLEYSRFGLYGAVIGQHVTGAVAAADADNYGFVVQGSYNINNKLEPFVRYEWIDAEAGTDQWSAVTVGANYYLRKHNAKFTVDMVWALDALTTANTMVGGQSGLGLINDPTGEDDQVALRAQFQLLF